MTPEEHAERAANLLRIAEDTYEYIVSRIDEGTPIDQFTADFAGIGATTQIAQVHAALALIPVRPRHRPIPPPAIPPHGA